MLSIKLIKEHSIFLIILISGLVLRLFPLFEYQFTLDEWSGLDRTRFSSFSELIDKGVKIDAHPALVQILLYYIVKIFGFTNWIIKLPFLLLSIGAIVYTYAFSLKNFSKQAALFAASLLTYSLLFVYYAPIARMYISGVFFSIGLLYHFFEIFFLKNNSKQQYILLGLFALLSALNQHINALFAFTVMASGLFFINKQNIKAFLITCIITLLLYLPHLSVTLYQLSIGGIGFEQGGWLPVPEAAAVFRFLKVLLGTGKTYIIILIIIALAAIVERKIKLEKGAVFLFVLFIVNYLIIYFYSVYRAPVFQYSVMLFSAVAIVPAITSFISFRNKTVFLASLFLFSAILIYKTYYKKDYLNQSVQNIFEFQFDKTAELKKSFGNENVFPVFFDADTLMREVCFKRGHYNFPCLITKDSATFSLRNYNKLIASLNQNILVLASAEPLHQAIAKEQFPYLIESIQTQGVNLKVFSKTKQNTVNDDQLIYHATYNQPEAFVFDQPQQLQKTKTGFTIPVDSFNEYPFAARAQLANISNKEGQVVLARTKIKANKGSLNGLRFCISITDQKTDSSYFYTDVISADFTINKDSSLTLYTSAFMGTDYYKIKDKAKITVFLWNTQKEKFTISDLEIKTLDYWNRKWNLWE